MFEDVLIESSSRKAGNKTAMTLPVSVAIHAVVIGLIVGASIWFVEDVPEPPIPVTFYAAAPPPPPEEVATVAEPASSTWMNDQTPPPFPTIGNLRFLTSSTRSPPRSRVS